MTDITVQYERKFSDGNYGSEGLSMSWSVTYEDDTELACDPIVVESRCKLIASALHDAVLGELANSAAWAVANSAKHELNPPNLTPASTAAEDRVLEEIPF